jgi:gliding motility-associated protein GldM
MSIPKEPRQLMINLMYLVLTALLALNVSAEVMNAFFSLDKGMQSSMKLIDGSNTRLKEGIDKIADVYKNEKNQKYAAAAQKAQEIEADFIKYIDNVRDSLMILGKGPSKADPTIPMDIRNKDITTLYFINNKKGEAIEKKILATRAALLALADNNVDVSGNMPLNVEAIPPGVKAKTWPDLKFKQMPIAACYPTLAKMQSDAKASTSAVLNYCSQMVNGEEIIRFNMYEPVLAANKSYLTTGEKYEAKVFLGAYSKDANNISINVNGASLPVDAGSATYTTTASGLGEKSVSVSIGVKNPLTGETKTYEKKFTYEVGQRSVAVSLDKMNVFYIGVDNPISVSAAGVNSNEVRVSGTGGGINLDKTGNGKYNVRVTTPTNECSITVSGGGASQTFQYRVKRIPDPVPRLGGNLANKGGTMPNGTFKAQGGISAMLENFDFDAKCDVVGFDFAYQPKRQDPIVAQNGGARWNNQIQGYINNAKPGDAYYFDDVKCKCPGDAAPRNIGSIAYKIK